MNKKSLIIIPLLGLVLSGCTLQSVKNKIIPNASPSPTPAPSVLPSPVVSPSYTPQKQIELNITSPQDNAVVTKPTLVVTGKTVPSADVSVNEVDTKADTKGNFSATLILEEGENAIMIVSSDQNGNYSETDLTVTYNIATS